MKNNHIKQIHELDSDKEYWYYLSSSVILKVKPSHIHIEDYEYEFDDYSFCSFISKEYDKDYIVTEEDLSRCIIYESIIDLVDDKFKE